MRILLDVDNVLLDWVSPVLEGLKYHGHSFTVEQVTDFNVGKALGVPWELIDQITHEEGWCLNIPLMPGSHAFVQELRRKGEVLVVTSPTKKSPHWLWERQCALKNHFGFEPGEICQWEKKHLIMGDVLIDDALHNCNAFHSKAILLDQPWNRAAPLQHVQRAFNYQHVLQLVDDMRKRRGF